jgi:hypothetical protein
MIRQQRVVTIARAKLYKSVPNVFVLEKNPTKLANEN